MVDVAARARVPHPSVAERAAGGKATRAGCARSRHAEWARSAERRPPEEVLLEQTADRIPYARLDVARILGRAGERMSAQERRAFERQVVEPTRDYYVRRLWDWKLGAEVELMSPARLSVYATLCGWTLARAHARAGYRVAIAAYRGSGRAFDRAAARFAERYADQNERDHAALVEAARAGRIAVGPGA